jgi:hypothetical protein
MAVAVLALAGALFAALTAEAPSDAELVARSQALMAAIAPGEVEVWRDTVAPDAVFTDEDGHVRSGAEAVKEIKPLPPGYSGEIKLESTRVDRYGRTAAVTYDAMETELIFGQTLHTRYRTTDVYQPVDGAWRIVASHTQVLPSEAKPLAKPAPLGDFAGVYRLGPTDRVTISVEGGVLYATRGEQPREALIALGGDHFARKGRNRGERIFVRDATGRVTGFADRRDNNDLMWRRERAGG